MTYYFTKEEEEELYNILLPIVGHLVGEKLQHIGHYASKQGEHNAEVIRALFSKIERKRDIQKQYEEDSRRW